MTNEELIYLYQNVDKKALEKLIEQNSGIMYKLVNKFYVEKTNSIDKEDLIQEGFIGLMMAAKKYDFNNEKKAKFTTYSVYWIYSKINRYITKKNTNAETSLNIPIGKDEDVELMETIEGVDYSFENVEERIYNQQLRKELEEVMNNYNTLQEREVLKLRHGWDNNQAMNFKEIGDIFKLPRERVRQIESRAYRKIRNTPYGVIKAKEMYNQKKSNYNINDLVNAMDFQCKYLSNEYLDNIIGGL